jgi:hypothetical protein
VTLRRSTYPRVQGGRHSLDWYDQRGEAVELRNGDRVLVVCEGGPCTSRLEIYPPRIEIEEREGTYVLADDGRRDDWRYVFVPHSL